MTNPPEDNLREPFIAPGSESADSAAPPEFDSAGQPFSAQQPASAPSPPNADPAAPAPPYSYPPVPNPWSSPTSGGPSSNIDQPLFQSFTQPPLRRPVRIPHFGHLLLLSLLLLVALGILALTLGIASHFHLFGLHLSAASATNLKFNLLSEAALYLIAFAFSLIVFPTIWNEGYFAGLQWRGDVVRARFSLLVATACACFGLALLDQFVMPGPPNAPIEKMMNTPSAAWLMFAFGITLAPFFEEMFFRGFLLPAFSTAYDWIAERIKHTLPRPLGAHGHPLWSMPAMVIGSIVTSVAFAGLHLAQQGNSLGPFLLLILISLILCTVRLATRSLAASTLVHATYNLLIFAVELIGTSGFRHFGKM